MQARGVIFRLEKSAKEVKGTKDGNGALVDASLEEGGVGG